MKRSDVLIFTTCYNERDNIGLLLDQIAAHAPDADVLVVDDNSPDGTWDVIQDRIRQRPNITAVQRPGKLGIGSAHKYAILYAIREGYSKLLTMDADFSHNPASIPALLAAHGENTFVTGSRYCEGGTSDYSGYRDIVSRAGNIAARAALGVRIHELTTYFRVFDVAALRRLPLRFIAASGYSYGVELVYYLRKTGVELREVPIHFVDRTRGASKIPKFQIFQSAFDLARLALGRLNRLKDMQPDSFVDDACTACGDRVLSMKHFGHSDREQGDEAHAQAYRCTSVGGRQYPPVYTCLCCGLEQVPASLIPENLEELYKDVVDTTYLENIPARRRTFERAFDAIAPHAPPRATLLEVGAYCGLFLDEVRNRGWDGVGVEPSQWSSTYARETTGVEVYSGYLSENAGNLRPPYDVVVSWDVLEHVRDPVAFLRECASYVKDDGVLCISTLDVDTWAPRLLKTRWPWLIDMHLYYFGRKTIPFLFRRAGLELVQDASYVHYARLRYFLNGASRALPTFLGRMVAGLAKLVPDAIVPVSFGDIRMYVLRKATPPSKEA
jgi:SAM-dependent methyltransferase